MKIAIVNTTRQKYGGGIYENMIAEVLSRNFEVEFYCAGVKKRSGLKYLEAPMVLWRLHRFSRRRDFDIVIRNFGASIFINKKHAKNVAIFHHIDNSLRPIIIRMILFIFDKLVFFNLKKVDGLVVEASYWENFLQGKGFNNIFKIYNCFNVNDFQFSEEEISGFKKKYKLTDKPIIYIGNCTRAKGVLESYAALKNYNFHLVTSGRPAIETPAINLNLGYRDYLRLLKASSVAVLMTKFKEGWNRTAHEAMLCKTPVVGSGTGGMRELLEGGQQIVCNDIYRLGEKVEFCLKHPEIGERGFNFAKSFTRERFSKEWLELLNEIQVEK